MEFSISSSIEVLENTPATVTALLHNRKRRLSHMDRSRPVAYCTDRLNHCHPTKAACRPFLLLSSLLKHL